MLTIVVIVTAVMLFCGIEFVMSRLFRGRSSAEFPSLEAYMRNFYQRQRWCRELHIVSALIIGIVPGLIVCWWQGYSAQPLLLTAIVLEACWLLLTYVFWRAKEQSYMEWPQFFSAGAIAISVGASCVLMGAALLPMLWAGLLFVVSFLLFMPIN